MKTPRNFSRYLKLAQNFLSNGRLPALLAATTQKITKKSAALSGLKDDLVLLQSLCMAWWRGEYRAVSNEALLAFVGALLYFVTPIDAIPDWILGVGFVDDLTVLAWVLRKWSDELRMFRLWQSQQPAEKLKRIEQLPELPALEMKELKP
ncbi:YkvA family protein [Pseudomonas sp. NPDC078700]|uniref:YkvA family protein n=1 Tax=Pseudomonas sp. NPDC078700 TaxID=3364424 RepID=UPI0037C9E0BE